MAAPQIVRATVEEAEALTAIALAAKGHWGYPAEWLREWQSALTITPDYINRHATFVRCDAAGTPLGFCAVQLAGDEALLDHLWVLPQAMGRGIGTALFGHAEAHAGAAGAKRLNIVGDPHAEKFYTRLGAVVHDRVSAPMHGLARSLPLLQKPLCPRNEPAL